jgi:hypothetical protein
MLLRTTENVLPGDAMASADENCNRQQGSHSHQDTLVNLLRFHVPSPFER